jgi:hypothetical protein
MIYGLVKALQEEPFPQYTPVKHATHVPTK